MSKVCKYGSFHFLSDATNATTQMGHKPHDDTQEKHSRPYHDEPKHHNRERMTNMANDALVISFSNSIAYWMNLAR
jgi:hypothetical protein